jgi:hypothetical protein
MASIRTSDVSVDDIDLGWDDESSPVPAVRASSISPAMNPTAPSRGSAVPQRSSSPRARAAMPVGAIRPLQAERSMPPRATPSVKPTGKPVASPITPRAALAVAPPSAAQQRSARPSSVRPVSMPPRPNSSSRSPEVPSVLPAQTEVAALESPVLPQVSEKLVPPPPVEAVAAIDLDAAEPPAIPAPVASMGTMPLESLPRAPSISAEWHEPGQDTLRPSQVELPSPLSNRARRIPPRRILLGAAIVALAGVIWLVASSTSSRPDTIATVPTAAQMVRPSRAAAAQLAAAVKLPSTTKAAATPATSAHAQGLVDSAKSALLGTEDTVLVAVHVSPPNAVVFKGGQRFGTGEVTVQVVRGTKTTLFARLDGYLPRIIVLDGTKTSVNIALIRSQSARVTVARKQPAQEAVTSSAKSEEESPARPGEPSEGASKRAETGASDMPSASDPEPSKRSDPMSDGDPL